MSIAIPFPEELPEGYQWMDEEPTFDPEKHLAFGITQANAFP